MNAVQNREALAALLARVVVPGRLLRPALGRGRVLGEMSEREFAGWQARSELYRQRREPALARAIARWLEAGNSVIEVSAGHYAHEWRIGERGTFIAPWRDDAAFIGAHVARRVVGFGWSLLFVPEGCGQIARLAIMFERRLRRYVPEEKWSELLAANRAERNPGICRSHDYCDANEAMIEAWGEVMQSELDVGSEEHAAAMDVAWELWRRLRGSGRALRLKRGGAA